MALLSLQPLKRVGLDENGELIAVRALVSLVLGYVLLYTPGIERTGGILCFMALAAHVLSGAAILRLPSRISKASWLLPAIFLLDLALISWVMSMAANAETDLYLVYFLVILMSGMQRDLRLSFLVGAVASVLYGFLWCKSNPIEDLFGARMLLRFPFFFIISFFSAYFAHRARRSERLLSETHGQLANAEKLASVGRLAAGMAHEFNNILTGITGNASFLEESLPADDARRRDARTILELSEKAAKLVNLLLNFSRRQPVFPAQVDLRQFLNEKAALLKDILGKNVEDHLELNPDLPAVLMDRDQLWHMISCLAVNAYEAMDGKGTFRLSAQRATRLELPPDLLASESPDYVRLTITDTGRGMPPELAAILFEPFLTTKPVGEGVGLSLASVYGTVKRAGGDLRVETAPGQGTAFHIYIPAQTAEQKRSPGARSF